MSDHSRFEELLMKDVDGVITDAERAELDAHATTCDSCAAERVDFHAIKETTDAMTQRILADARIQPPETGAVAAFTTMSLLAILAGVVVLLGFGGYVFATDPDVPAWVKTGAGLCAVGGLGLLGYALSLAWRARGGRDPYQEIDR